MEEYSMEEFDRSDDFARALELPKLSKLRSRSSSREYLVASVTRHGERNTSERANYTTAIPGRASIEDDSHGIGVPGLKPPIDWIGLVAPVCSLVCLIVTFVVVSEKTKIPFDLGYNNQIIVIGFIMGLEGLCLKRNTLILFTLLEARFGKSRLQNYDAILRSSSTADHASLFWKATILALILLPLGISVSYKQFPNGQSTWSLANSTQDYSYFGLTGPEGILNPGSDDSVSLMVNATIPFRYNSLRTPDFSPELTPLAYGFNLLVLSDSSTASLDAPMPDFVSRIQRDLGAGYHTYSLTADVYATVTRVDHALNASTRTENSFWEQYMGNGLYAQHIYNGYQVDLLSLSVGFGDNSWCFVALVPSRNDYQNPLTITQGIVDFEDKAVMFTTRREKCRGTWDITSNSIELVGGFCYDDELTVWDQGILTNTYLALSSYYLPLLGESLGPYTLSRNTSSWTLPSMTSAVSAMYWSRLIAVNNTQYGNTTNYFRPFAATATRDVMHAVWPLYVVLSIIPGMAVAVFIGSCCFYSTPITRGFGLVSIMAGVDRSSLDIARGASLTGKFKRPVTLKISVVEEQGRAGSTATSECISYALVDNRRWGNMKTDIQHDETHEVSRRVKRSTVYH